MNPTVKCSNIVTIHSLSHFCHSPTMAQYPILTVQKCSLLSLALLQNGRAGNHKTPCLTTCTRFTDIFPDQSEWYFARPFLSTLITSFLPPSLFIHFFISSFFCERRSSGQCTSMQVLLVRRIRKIIQLGSAVQESAVRVTHY